MISIHPIVVASAACALVLTISPADLLGQPALFRRGDSNTSGDVNLTDAIHTLRYLFVGRPPALACRDAADTDDSGDLNLTDGVRILSFLFRGSPPPPPPFEDCGVDPSGDELDCESFPPCPPPVERPRSP